MYTASLQSARRLAKPRSKEASEVKDEASDERNEWLYPFGVRRLRCNLSIEKMSSTLRSRISSRSRCI